jgi:hypothetical protein
MNQESDIDFQLCSESDYKILIKIYQKKVFELFNQNIALEARNLSLTDLVDKLTKRINSITEKEPERNNNKRKIKSNNNSTSRNSTDLLDSTTSVIE